MSGGGGGGHGYFGGSEMNGRNTDNGFLGSGGDDYFDGGAGEDQMWGYNGNDTLFLGAGNEGAYGGMVVTGYGEAQVMMLCLVKTETTPYGVGPSMTGYRVAVAMIN
jgi:hypothetical protein